MRILCIADDCPWPQHSGRRVRLANVVRALATLGDVDCFVVLNDARPDPVCEPPIDSGVARLHVVHERTPTSKFGRPGRWVTSSRPLGTLWRRWSTARHELRRWVERPYDLVWFGRAESFLALRDAVSAPRVVVDFDDLEDQRLVQRQRARSADATWVKKQSAPLRWLRAWVDRVDIHRWARLQRQVARAVDTVAVCSRLDEERLGVPNAFVVRNGYDLPDDAGAQRRVGHEGPPVIVMVGVFAYEPNADGAWWFAEEVAPLIRERIGPVELRLVGPRAKGIEGLEGRPGVSIVGLVPDLRVELERADIEVVPIRSGGGTRVKMLEAFAHRVPVVSTSMGAEGIDVTDGVHLLVADEPAPFADACVRLLTDARFADRLGAAAFELWRNSYRWQDLRLVLADHLRAPDPTSTGVAPDRSAMKP